MSSMLPMVPLLLCLVLALSTRMQRKFERQPSIPSQGTSLFIGRGQIINIQSIEWLPRLVFHNFSSILKL